MPRRILVLTFAVAMMSLFVSAEAPAVHNTDDHTANMSLVKNLRYQHRNGATSQGGSDIEFARLGSPPRWYALAGTYWNGLQIVDIAWPPRAQIVGVYDCAITQGDVQVFTQADEPGRTFVTYTSDTGARTASPCYQEAKALGDWGTGQSNFGTFIAEITDPRNPRTIAFIPIAKGSHNQTVHPSGNYLYNSNSDLATDISPSIEIFDISDINNPVFVRNLPMPIRPGLGSDSHDITFNASGTRAYTAAISHTSIIDTTNPANPVILNTIFDPTVNVSHQADPITMRDNTTGQMKTFVIVSDELAGAAGNFACPGGGLHVYDVTNDAFTKVGFWVTGFTGQTQSPLSIPVCTSHVFRIHAPEKLLTIAWYSAGVRVVDISQLAGFSVGSTGSGMREIGHYRTPNADTWAAKTPFIDRNGDFWLFGNDIGRGLDIYHFDGDGQQNMSQNPGTWESGPGAGAQQDQGAFSKIPYDLSTGTHLGA